MPQLYSENLDAPLYTLNMSDVLRSKCVYMYEDTIELLDIKYQVSKIAIDASMMIKTEVKLLIQIPVVSEHLKSGEFVLRTTAAMRHKIK